MITVKLGKVTKIHTYRHLRNEFGGVTAVCEYSPRGKTLLVGFSFCSPSEDNFNKMRGRKIAEARLERHPIRIKRVGGIIKSLITHLKSQGMRLCGNPNNIPKNAPYLRKVFRTAYKELGIDRYIRKDTAAGYFISWFRDFAMNLVIYDKNQNHIKKLA